MSVGLAAAQDHLVCYRMKTRSGCEPPPRPGWISPAAVRLEQCKIVGGFRLFCVPVDKTVTAPIERKIAPAPYEAFTPNPEPGLGEQDRLCYKIKCTTNAARRRSSSRTSSRRGRSRRRSRISCAAGGEVPHPTTSLPPCRPRRVVLDRDVDDEHDVDDAAPLLRGGRFLSLTTTQTNFGADAGDLTRADGTPFPRTRTSRSWALPRRRRRFRRAAADSPDMGQLITQITSLGGGCAATLGRRRRPPPAATGSCTAAGCLFGAPLPVPNAGSTPPASAASRRWRVGGASGRATAARARST
jgi:hypothetical protein